jgi:hypothetical protein
MVRTDKNLRPVMEFPGGIDSIFCYCTGLTYTQEAVEVKEVLSVYSVARVD